MSNLVMANLDTRLLLTDKQWRRYREYVLKSPPSSDTKVSLKTILAQLVRQVEQHDLDSLQRSELQALRRETAWARW